MGKRDALLPARLNFRTAENITSLRRPPSDATNGESRGKTMQHKSRVTAVAFSLDGKTVLTGSWDVTARLWDVTLPALDDPERLRLSVEVRTGHFFNESGRMQPRTQKQWLDRMKKLKALGGSFDIILPPIRRR